MKANLIKNRQVPTQAMKIRHALMMFFLLISSSFSFADPAFMTKKSIGPAGGKIEFAGDVSSVVMEIPPGALSRNTEITIRQVPAPPPGKFMQAGMAVGNVFSFEPHGLTFSRVVSVTFTYSDKNLPRGANEGGVLIYRDMPDGRFGIDGGAQCDPEDEPGPHCIDTESYAQDIDIEKNLAAVFINTLSRRLPYYAGSGE